MSEKQKIIIMPFKKGKRGSLTPGEMREASSAAAAERTVDAMASRFAGVAAFEVTVDDENGYFSSPRLLHSCGTIINLSKDD